ncbi:hypothetical protein PG993_004995 [Apiospora rasikravindrae]|uniref:Uncharacterized protein n=1 Tax=Apiospora rasikravindrae TaxID=990691 RepID=A0ABR1TEC9_9PEZI
MVWPMPTTTVGLSSFKVIPMPTSPPPVSSTQAPSMTTTVAPAWTSIETNPALYNMALTTTFTQPPQCSGEVITQMAWRGSRLWENAINPLATSTVTTCYPSQFYSSVMGTVNSIALPAFEKLVCPPQLERRDVQRHLRHMLSQWIRHRGSVLCRHAREAILWCSVYVAFGTQPAVRYYFLRHSFVLGCRSYPSS